MASQHGQRGHLPEPEQHRPVQQRDDRLRRNRHPEHRGRRRDGRAQWLRDRAIFSNALGQYTSGAAALTVDYAPTIAAIPTNQSDAAGRPVSFTAAETAGNPTASAVQWQVSTNNGGAFQNLSNSALYSDVTTLTGGSATLYITGRDPKLERR